MKTSERLQQRLRDELGLDVDLPKSLRPGRHQRSAGAWSWCAEYDGGTLGSDDTMSECVKAKKLSWFVSRMSGDIDISAE